MKKIAFAIAAAATVCAPASAAVTIWNSGAGANGHAYEFVSGNFTWQQALDAAAARTFDGQRGYLVTVTSDAENVFLRQRVTQNTAWAAGSDAAVEGTWAWAAGPEAGTVFFIRGVGVQTYANFASGEPNDRLSNEDGLVVNHANTFRWNDLPTSEGHGFIVEYGGLAIGGVPEPTAWALMILGFGAVGGALRRNRKVRASLAYA